MDIATLNLCPGGRLGDRFLHILGFYIICKYLNLRPNISTFFTNIDINWSYYDKNLYKFSDDFILTNTNDTKYCFTVPNAPIKVYDFLIKNNINVSFEQISNDYIHYGKEIFKPSQIIIDKIPDGLNDVYGIHLRKSDKIVYNRTRSYIEAPTEQEFQIIMDDLLKDVMNIIDTENNPKFLIVSEDNDWKMHISQKILNYANENNKKIELVKLDYTNENNYINYESILDFFCLSKCKEILMGNKSTGFSYAPSIIGGKNKIRTYCNNIENTKKIYYNSMSSIIKFNNENFNYDINYHREVLEEFTNIDVYLIK